jgi:mono/diheme cytochrome c family protein
MVPMPQKTLDLILSYLTQQQLPKGEMQYFSLAENTPYLHLNRDGSGRLYAKHCAACHGIGGNADGYNADFLPTPPTAHADSAYMSTRPDDLCSTGSTPAPTS